MSAMLLEMLKLFAIDLLFLVALALLLIPLAMFRPAAYAVLKRNFVGYFSNPTGYVFLCLFVFLTSLAAFWPHEFFLSNLANLDQLNTWMPRIMLVFIPAITMSLWADERRQGTDELLLTLPAGDFDIVIGKYLSAAAIFTVSLLFSQLSNYSVLVSLTTGDVDSGLIFTTYFGYWMMGLAMLSIGMVASFLTSNLTVGFILGLIFNAGLVFLGFADTVIPSNTLAANVEKFSVGGQFDDFGRGVMSLSSIAYFALLTGVGIYLSMVLIGRRHWSGGRDGQSLWGHYLLRTVAVVGIVLGVNMLLMGHDFLRQDLTGGQVSSLSPDTKALLADLGKSTEGEDDSRPIQIDAFISARVPDEYIKTKYNLVSMLKELERQAGSRIRVRMHDNLEPFSEEASLAEERFGIRKQTVISRARGAVKEEQFILGAAFTCGLEKVVVPFFGNGTPVEYELIRSIATVGAKGDRKRLGVVTTDAQMFGGFSFAGGQPSQTPKQMIVEELEKQYRVEEVDPTNPIEPDKYDVLLIVQPSSLGPQQMANVVAAIAQGQPAAIFEDPLPLPQFMPGLVGTNQEKRPQGMFGMNQPPPQKGDIRALWKTLGIKTTGDGGDRAPVPGVLVWQYYNPYPKFQIAGMGPEFVFASNSAPGGAGSFNPNVAVTNGFEELLFPYPGGVAEGEGATTEFIDLVATGDEAAGVLEVNELIANAADPYLLASKRGKPTGRRYTLAAWLKGKSDAADSADDKKAEDKSADKKSDDTAKADDKPRAQGVNVIYICDVDMLSSTFVSLRNQPDADNDFRFDNVPFVLNVIDAVAGDDRFLQIRTRKPQHSTLAAIESRAAEAREKENIEAQKSRDAYDKAVKESDAEAKQAYEKLQTLVDGLRKQQQEGKQVDPGELDTQFKSLQIVQETSNRRSEVKKEKLRIERDRNLERIQRERDQEVQQVQNEYKLWAALLPPIPPLLVGLVVWVRRRLREREGISRSRMRT